MKAGEDDPPGVEEHGNQQRPDEEDRLARDEPGEIPAARRAHRGAADAPAAQGVEIAEPLQPQAHEAVERPDVDVLEAIPRPRRLSGDEPRDRHLRDVVVVPVDVRVRVMRDVVPDAPGVARDPEQRIGAPAQQVVVARAAERRAVVCVVLHAEAREDGAGHQGEEEQRRQHPVVRAEHEQGPGDDDQADRDRHLGVQVDLRAPMRHAGEVGLDLAAGLAYERAAALEGELLRRAHRVLAPRSHCYGFRRALGDRVGARAPYEGRLRKGSPAPVRQPLPLYRVPREAGIREYRRDEAAERPGDDCKPPPGDPR